MKTHYDVMYECLCKVLMKVHLQMAAGHVKKREGGWSYEIRTFCPTGGTQVKLLLNNKTVDVVGHSNSSANEALENLVLNLASGKIQVSSGNEKKLYRFNGGFVPEKYEFTELLDSVKV